MIFFGDLAKQNQIEKFRIMILEKVYFRSVYYACCITRDHQVAIYQYQWNQSMEFDGYSNRLHV